MKNKSVLIFFSSHLLAASAMAGTMGSTTPDSFWVGTFSAGPVWERAGSTQTFYLTPEIEKTYVANQSTHTLFDGEVFLGIQKTLTPSFQGQFGVAVGFTSDANLKGVIWDDADPRFNNFIYRYKIQHTHVALKGKLLADVEAWLIPCWVSPWISGSVGVGFNDAHQFQNTPIIPEAVPTPNFSSHTQTAFTYTVGAGIQKVLNENWQVGVGYEFADWGKSRLGRAEDQTLNHGLGLNHLYTHGVLFNLTYLS